jgi:hypothetical protein
MVLAKNGAETSARSELTGHSSKILTAAQQIDRTEEAAAIIPPEIRKHRRVADLP